MKYKIEYYTDNHAVVWKLGFFKKEVVFRRSGPDCKSACRSYINFITKKIK